jgi:hypothetical protein
MGGEPPLDLGRPVGRAIVEHEVHVRVLGDLLVDRDNELVELDRAVAYSWLMTMRVVRSSAVYQAGGAVQRFLSRPWLDLSGGGLGKGPELVREGRERRQ